MNKFFRSLPDSADRFSGPAAVVFASCVAVFLGGRITQADSLQMVPSVNAFMSLDWGNLYPSGTMATSMVVWLAMVGVPFALLRNFVSVESAWGLSGILVSFPLLIGGVYYAVRRIYPHVEIWKAWALGCLALVLPTTLACWLEFYHPQDVAAIGIVLFGLGFAAQRRWLAAGVIFGLAILTRQWAALIALAISPLASSRRDFVRFCGSGGIVTLLGIAPLFLLGNEGLWSALSASNVVGSYETVMGRLVFRSDEEQSIFTVVVRYAPLALTAALAFLVWVKKWVSPQLLLPLAASVIAFRLFFESAPFLYYWAPLFVFLLVSGGVKKFVVVGVSLSATALWLGQMALRSWGTPQNTLSSGSLSAGMFIFFSVGALALAWYLARVALRGEKQQLAARNDGSSLSKRSNSLVWSGAAALSVSMLLVSANNFYRPVDFRETPPVVGGSAYISSAAVNVTGSSLSEWTPAATQAGEKFPVLTGKSWDGSDVVVGSSGPPKIVALLAHWDSNSQNFVADFSAGDTARVLNGVSVEVVLVEDNFEKGNWPASLWLKSQEWEPLTLVDSENGDARRALGNPPTPTFFALNADGFVAGVHFGPISEEKLKGLADAART